MKEIGIRQFMLFPASSWPSKPDSQPSNASEYQSEDQRSSDLFYRLAPSLGFE